MFLTSRRASVAVAALGLIVGGSGVALAASQTHGHVNTQRGGWQASDDTPHNIPNLGKVKTRIETYYGDHGNHAASPHSRYAHQVYNVERRARRMLPHLIRRANNQPVVLVDVDDTTLLTYNYDATHDFGYDPVANDTYIRKHGMTKVFGMPKLLRQAHHMGAQIFYLTGRPESQRRPTVRDLRKAHYPVVKNRRLFLHNRDNPPAYLSSCAPDCSTIQYKSKTRRHIEHLGNGKQIVLNMGDQHSDLKGGFADRRLKVPNPMYYLP